MPVLLLAEPVSGQPGLAWETTVGASSGQRAQRRQWGSLVAAETLLPRLTVPAARAAIGWAGKQ